MRDYVSYTVDVPVDVEMLVSLRVGEFEDDDDVYGFILEEHMKEFERLVPIGADVFENYNSIEVGEEVLDRLTGLFPHLFEYRGVDDGRRPYDVPLFEL